MTDAFVRFGYFNQLIKMSVVIDVPLNPDMGNLTNVVIAKIRILK